MNIFQFVVTVCKLDIISFCKSITEIVACSGLQCFSVVHQGFNRVSCFCSGKFFFVVLSSFYNRDRQNFFTEICINIQHLDRTCFCFFCCCV